MVLTGMTLQFYDKCLHDDDMIMVQQFLASMWGNKEHEYKRDNYKMKITLNSLNDTKLQS